jgi:hypothetical protein
VKDGGLEGWVWGDGKASPLADILTDDMCDVLSTATPITVAKQDADPTPSPTRAATVPLLAQTVVRAESETGSPSPLPQVSSPAETATPAQMPSPSTLASPATGSLTFAWLIAGLSGLGIVLLALAYFLMRRRA